MSEGTPKETLISPGSNLLFISHWHEEKDVAVELKSTLRILGFQGFVAHEDIEPTREWEDEILRALKTCCALAAITSPGARSSAWVNQEIGAVVIRERPVFSIAHGSAPWGLLYRFQSVRWKRAPPGKTGKAVEREVLEANLPALCKALKGFNLLTTSHLVEGLGASWSFEEARVVVQLIHESGKLEAEQALRLVYLASQNQNITGCWEAQRKLPPLLRPYKRLFPGDLLKTLDAQDFGI